MTEDRRIIASLHVTPARRLTGLTVLASLTVLCVIIAVRESGFRALLIGALAPGAAALTISIWRASGHQILLTPDGLFDSNGTIIAELADIARINDHILAVRPSNGLSLALTARKGAHWAPGLWWRWRRTVGIGGLTSAKQGRDLARLLHDQLAQHRATRTAEDRP